IALNYRREAQIVPMRIGAQSEHLPSGKADAHFFVGKCFLLCYYIVRLRKKTKRREYHGRN
ncbi:MAG: hypothetical protein ACI4AD_12550, partial [Roseburia sp.]